MTGTITVAAAGLDSLIVVINSSGSAHAFQPIAVGGVTTVKATGYVTGRTAAARAHTVTSD